MKKRVFLLLAIVAIVACVFAVSVSAADSINPSSSNEFGTLTTFDGDIGNTNISQNKDDGTIARTVIFDGTNYYTVPTVYLLKEYTKPKGEFFLLNFSELSGKLNGVTLSKASIIRMELPTDIYYFAGSDSECLRGCSNMVELKLNRNLHFWDNSTAKAFSNCSSLTVLDVSMVNFDQVNSLYSVFEYCTSLKKVILPKEPFKNNGVAVNYATNYMFHGCTALEEIVNLDSFFSGTTVVAHRMFANCKKLKEITLWDGLQGIDSKSFSSCEAIQTIIIPDTVTYVGTSSGGSVFDGCTALKTVVMSKNTTYLSPYCFEKCTALEKVWMPAPWITTSTAKLTMSNQVFGQAKKSGVKFYLMCTEAQMATYIDQSAYTSDNNTDAWKHGDFIYGATLADKCTIFLGGHEKPASVNSCTSGGNCLVCATALAGIASEHNLVTTLTYPNGFAKNGVKATVCQNWERCTAENESVATNPIFASVGYSYREDTNRSGLTSGFTLDRDALDKFVAFNPDADLVVSIFVVSPTMLTGDNFFEGGELCAQKGIQIDISSLSYDNYNYFISGFTLEQMQKAELVFGMLVCNGEDEEIIQKQYAENEVSTTKATYTDKKGVTLASVTVQSVDPAMVEALIAESKKEQE